MPDRRKLRFESFDEVLADVDRLVLAEQSGTLTRAGTWPLGRTLNHLAAWTSFATDGYPPEVRASAPLRFFMKLFKNRILNKGMIAGVKVGKAPGGTVAMEDVPTDQAFARLRREYDRIARQAPTLPNPLFGPLSHQQWTNLNLRHAELHLSFQIPG